ncbi:MAG: ATP-binding cassette domain-containing protein [Candidatus Cloacimonadaceae bacterium]|jgi:ABC-2 type transport system ATP-binding protein|nr:ATP-binding cassette domain-containing protein [Candidatus Cloacimonadaceae bacterium]
MPGLQVCELCKSYANKLVADHISFSVQSGEIMGFLGPNGAGKTTTIRMIMGITAPDSGKIEFLDQKSQGIPCSAIGYLPEERGLYKESKVIGILRFLAGLKGVDRNTATQRAYKWLKKFDLTAYANRKVEELSKGMAQKVQFIATVIHEPQYIILDEPFSGLDPVSQDTFKYELRALADSGVTILLSSHQMNILEELCDKIFLINHGKELFFGRITDLQDLYGSFAIKLKLKDMAEMQRLSALPTVASVVQNGQNSVELLMKEGMNPQSLLKEILVDIGLSELSLAKTSLHEIFVKIAKEASDEK